MKTKTFSFIALVLFALLSPSPILAASASTVTNNNEDDSISANNDEVETSPLMMFGWDKKSEEKKENLSTAEKTAQSRRNAEVAEQEREQESTAIKAGVITVSGYCNFLNAVAADDPDGLYEVNQTGGWRLEAGGPDIVYDNLLLRLGKPGSYHYEAIKGKENCQINYLSELNAIRYRDWLDNEDKADQSITTISTVLLPKGPLKKIAQNNNVPPTATSNRYHDTFVETLVTKLKSEALKAKQELEEAEELYRTACNEVMTISDEDEKEAAKQRAKSLAEIVTHAKEAAENAALKASQAKEWTDLSLAEKTIKLKEQLSEARRITNKETFKKADEAWKAREEIWNKYDENRYILTDVNRAFEKFKLEIEKDKISINHLTSINNNNAKQPEQADLSTTLARALLPLITGHAQSWLNQKADSTISKTIDEIETLKNNSWENIQKGVRCNKSITEAAEKEAIDHCSNVVNTYVKRGCDTAYGDEKLVAKTLSEILENPLSSEGYWDDKTFSKPLTTLAAVKDDIAKTEKNIEEKKVRIQELTQIEEDKIKEKNCIEKEIKPFVEDPTNSKPSREKALENWWRAIDAVKEAMNALDKANEELRTLQKREENLQIVHRHFLRVKAIKKAEQAASGAFHVF